MNERIEELQEARDAAATNAGRDRRRVEAMTPKREEAEAALATITEQLADPDVEGKALDSLLEGKVKAQTRLAAVAEEETRALGVYRTSAATLEEAEQALAHAQACEIQEQMGDEVEAFHKLTQTIVREQLMPEARKVAALARKRAELFHRAGEADSGMYTSAYGLVVAVTREFGSGFAPGEWAAVFAETVETS